jgi:tetratricopeptide (TPR) repeat protein
MSGQDPAGADNTISSGTFYGPVLQGRDIQATLHLPAAAPTALAQLPSSVTAFTGRDDELAVLAGLLDPAGTSGPVLVSAVAGLAGVGKTTLAVQAGHAALERGWFGGGVLFLDLHGYDKAPVQPSQALDALLRALGVPAEHIPPTMDERAGLYRSMLAEVSEPMLVIADNASAEAQVKPLLPGTGPHKVLVTSRHTLAGLGARLVDVTVLNEATAIDLLDAALRSARPSDARISGDPQAAARLARLCGGLPLALQITVALLNIDPALSSAELAGELSGEQDRLAALRYDDGSGMAGLSVAAAFGLSYHRLADTNARVFRLLTVSPGPDVATAVAAVLADLPVPEVRRALAALTAAHLIEAAPDKPGRWRMHDLVHLYAIQLTDERDQADERAQATDRLLDYYIDMTGDASARLRALPGTRHRGEFETQEAALEWLDAERASLVATIQVAADTGRDEAALALPLLLGRYFDRRRRFDDWITTTVVSLDTARRLGDRDNEAGALANLSNALRETRQFEEAVTASQEAIAIFRETGERYSEGVALGNLGVALLTVGRLEEAITATQDAAAIYHEADDRQGEAGMMDHLGLALRFARRYGEAITAHRDAAAIYHEIGDRRGEGGALVNLGGTLLEARRFEEAVTASQEAVAIFRETGDPHHESLALQNLGLALKEVGRSEEAITACQDATAISREAGDQQGEGLALVALGEALQEVQRIEEAITAYQDAAAILREAGDQQSEGLALVALGEALQKVQRIEEAITALHDAAALFREAGDQGNEGVALANLGEALQQMERFEEAITALQDAAAIFHETEDQSRKGIVLGTIEAVRTAQQSGSGGAKRRTQ